MNIGTFLGYGATVFTPWMRRQADYALFTFEVIDNPDGLDVTFERYDRNTEDYGSGQPTGVVLTITTGSDTYAVSNLLEMIRFKITVAGPEASPTGTGVIYRMLEPTWYNEAKV